MIRLSRSILSLTISTIIIVGCSGQTEADVPEHIKKLEKLTIYEADAQPEYEISLEPEITFRDTGRVRFGRIIRWVEADSKGHTYILDNTENTIHVFNSEGEYLDSIGREGRGPGEFMLVADYQVDDQFLHVLDRRQRKISVFHTTDFEHQRDINVDINEKENKPSWLDRVRQNRTAYFPNDFYPLSNGNYLVIFSDNGVAVADNLPGRTYEFSGFNPEEEAYSHGLLSFDWTGGVLVNESNNVTTVRFDVPYKRKSEFDVENGQLVYGWTENFLFKVYDAMGNYRHAFYYPFGKIELSEEKALAHFNDPDDNTTKAAVRNDTLPATFPAFNTVLLDSKQRIWVSSVTEDSEEYLWRVLNLEGKLLAQFRWPRSRSIKTVEGDSVYTIQYNPQTGAPLIKRYAVTLK